MAPRVSIVLPVYNTAPTIGAAIESMRVQTFPDWEMLVVEDGSTDDTAARAREAAQNDPRIRVIMQPHAGVTSALARGVAHARGEFIARMDGDDVSCPGRLEEQVRFLEGRNDIGVAGCLVEYGGDATVNAGYALHVDWMNHVVSAEEIALNRFVESPLAHPSVMFRRELVDRFGGYREGDFPEDYELWLRWMDAGVRMAKVPQVLLRWNDPPGRLSRTDARYGDDRFFRMKAAWIASELARRGLTQNTAAVTGSLQYAPKPAIWIWGAGRPTRKRAGHVEQHGVRIAGYIDIDLKKTGRVVGGVPVLPPTELPSPAHAFVLGYVGSRGARDYIRVQLRTRGYIEGTHFLMCA